MTTIAADVAVVGGGPAGAATAIALRRAGVSRVVLVEAGDHAVPRVGESVPPDTRIALRELGLLEPFLAQGHLRSKGSCSAWGSNVLGYNDVVVSPHGDGWHLDRPRFDRWLVSRAAAQGVDVHVRTRFRGLRPGAADRPIRLALDCDGRRLTVDCDAVVDASGRRSVVGRRLGARRRVESTLVATVGWLDGADWHGSLTMLEAVEYGWWYLARLPDDVVVAAVASDGAGIRERGLDEPTAWLSALRRTVHVGPLVAAAGLRGGALMASAIPVSVLDPPAGPGWLAVGDAAVVHDPVTSQGVHTALAGGLAAAQAVTRWLARDRTSLVDYRAAVGRHFIEHLRQREELYSLERRWTSSSFWLKQTRRSRGAAA